MNSLDNMKTRILFYSDCFIFGGCEKVLVNLLFNKNIDSNYDIYFAYAGNKYYKLGVEQALKGIKNIYPLRVLANNNLFYRIDLSGINRLVLAICKVPFKLLDAMGLYGIHNFIRLFFFFRRIKPDILYINNGGYPAAASCIMAVFSAKCSGVDNIVFNVNNLAQKQKSLLDRVIDSYVGKNVTFFVTASRAAGMRLAENRRFDCTKILQIPNTLSNEETIGEITCCLRTELGIEASTLIIGSAGLLTRRKGFDVLIDAISLIERETEKKDYRVIILGEGEERKNLEKQVEKYGLRGKVLFLGHRSNILSFVKDFDVFVMPSRCNEDLPYAILEAMLLKKPIIGTCVAGIPEQIDDGKSGILVPPGDAVLLAAAIKRMMSSRDMASEMGKASYVKYMAEFRYDLVMDKYLKLFKSLEQCH